MTLKRTLLLSSVHRGPGHGIADPGRRARPRRARRRREPGAGAVFGGFDARRARGGTRPHPRRARRSSRRRGAPHRWQGRPRTAAPAARTCRGRRGARLRGDRRRRVCRAELDLSARRDLERPVLHERIVVGHVRRRHRPGQSVRQPGRRSVGGRQHRQSASVYVGIIDEGVMRTHPDLTANVLDQPVRSGRRHRQRRQRLHRRHPRLGLRRQRQHDLRRHRRTITARTSPAPSAPWAATARASPASTGTSR